jgi:DNA polymerase-3 subunit epsilon
MPPTRRTASSKPLHELEYVVVDVETTGRSGRADRVADVAAVVVRGGRIAERYASLVNPGCGIPSAITRLTGITNAMASVAPRFEDIATDVAMAVRNRVFVAHNAAFDWAFLNAEFARVRTRPMRGERLCTVRLARRLLPHLPRRNLDAVTAHYGIAITDRHRAHGDADATADVFVHMLDELGGRGVHTWGELRALLDGGTRRKRTALPRWVTDFRIA